MSDERPELYCGVLLAAGRSRRMGSTKQLLPVPAVGAGAHVTVPMIVRSFDLLASVCGDRIVVVLGHDADAVAAALRGRMYREVRSDPDADMFTSVRAGLQRAREFVAATRSCWLHPADVPLVRPETLREMDQFARRWHPDRAVVPVHAGRGGHPAILPWQIIDQVMAWTGAGGLRGLWSAKPDLRVRLEVQDPAVAIDVDTPEAYSALWEGPASDQRAPPTGSPFLTGLGPSP